MSSVNKIIKINDIENNIYYKSNPLYFLLLKLLVENHHRNYSSLLTKTKTYKDLNIWINSLLPLLQDNIYKCSTKCWWIFNNINTFPKCKFCKKEYKNINVSTVETGYNKYCSYKCMCKDPDYWQYYRTCILQKYGENITNVFLLLSTKNKIKQTSLERYGIEYATATENAKQKKCLTNIERYGVPHVLQSPEIMKKFKKAYMSGMVKIIQ